MARSSLQRLVVSAVFSVASVLLGDAARAADVVTVGNATAAGPTVEVPVFIRDVSGSPLGMDQPAASRIQAFSIRVNFAPASAVSSVTFTRAGLTSSLQPAFETSPSSAGSISLLASFQQSSNPIPFTLNGSSPGDQVARLVFTLSPSASPGTTITLTLDSGTTQLTDEGGSAATKETAGNGQLSLVNGSITIPVPSVSVTPSSQELEAGSSGSATVTTSVRLVNAAALTLTSSNPAVAAVPSSATIQAGARTANFAVTAVSSGSATITATLPASAGGGSATAAVTVTPADECAAPPTPQVSGPQSALAGAVYAITWSAVAGATDYVIEESADAAFSNATSQTVTAVTVSYAKGTAGARYYYRVRARNRAGTCNVSSPVSTVISVLITSTPPPPSVLVFPAVGSAPGNNGSYFKTAVQLYNPRANAVSGKIVFHPQGSAGSASDPVLTYSIPPGATLAYADLLPAMGVASGLGSADLISDATSPLPVALARVFNDGGTAGTTGLALVAMATGEALGSGRVGSLFAPADLQRFRLNIGVRTLEEGAAMNVTVRGRDGEVLKTVQRSFPATYFAQTGSTEFLGGYVLSGGETISVEMTSGSAIVYGATTDNVTNDPSVQFARAIE
jgi:uncharacterized protein YjdB